MMMGATRHLKILEYALSALWRRKFKALSVVAVFAFTISILASVLLLTRSLRVEASKLLEATPDVVVQRIMAGRHDLIPVERGRDYARMPGVEEVHPRFWGYHYDAVSGSNYTLMSVAEERGDIVELIEGNMPQNIGECALGKGVAYLRSLSIGDELILVNSQNVGVVYDVVGIFLVESSLLTNDLVVMNEGDLIEFFGFPEGFATDIVISVYNKNEIQNIAEKVQQIHPDTRPITASEIARTYDGVFHWRSGMMLTVFFSALAAFGVLAWDKATGISAEETREIGVLKAIGWATSDVLELKFWEGMVVSGTSFLVGLVVAYIHVFVFGAPLLARVLKGWSVLFPEFRPVPYIDLYQVFVMGFLTVVPYIVCTLVPSWKTAVTDPEEVMRG